MRATSWDVPLTFPLKITEARYFEGVMSFRGSDWALSTLCAWRWVHPDGAVISERTPDLETKITGLIDDEILGIRWYGPPQLQGDPTFDLASGGEVTVMSDAPFDTWTFRAPGVMLIGP